MRNILSFILDQLQKYKRNLFLNSDSITISSMVYQGENMLVIKSKIQDGCRILLNRSDLLRLQDLEWSILETIERKTKIVKPLVKQQINQIALYLKTNTEVETRTFEDMTNCVKSINNIFISTHVNDYNFTSQFQCMSEFFTNLQILKFNTLTNKWDNIINTCNIKFVHGWLVSIAGLLRLHTNLSNENNKVQTIYTNRLNQDCLENFFGITRSQNGSCINPTPIQFQRTFKKLFCLNYF